MKQEQPDMSSNMGLDYFNIDVDIFDDAKIIKLMKRYGPLGFMSYIITLTNVYKKGYFLEASVDDLAHILLNRIGGKYVSGKYKLQEIILYMASINLISAELLKQNVISSKGIQKRFVKMTKGRKEQDLSKYWILDQKPDKAIKITQVIEESIESYMDEDYFNSLSKEEQKKIKRKEARYKKIKEQGPDKHYLTSCLLNYRYIDDYDLDVHQYNQLFEELNKAYDQDIVFEATKYICNYASRKTTQIRDKYHFFEKSIHENLKLLTKRREKDPNQSFDEYLNELLDSVYHQQ